MDNSGVDNILAADMEAVDSLIVNSLYSSADLIKNHVGLYILNNGGQRLRLVIILLGVYALNYQGNKHIKLTVILEFIHTAFRLHGNISNGSGKSSTDKFNPGKSNKSMATVLQGKATRILVGDFLYSRAFSMMVELEKMQVMEILLDAISRTSEGKTQRLLQCNNPYTTEKQYDALIQRETSTLFEAGTRLSAVLCDGSTEEESALANYGRHLGVIYQLREDVFNCSSSTNNGLKKGSLSMPVIRAMQVAAPTLRTMLGEAIERGADIETIADYLDKTDAIEYTKMLAFEEGQKAKAELEALPASPYREALVRLSEPPSSQLSALNIQYGSQAHPVSISAR